MAWVKDPVSDKWVDNSSGIDFLGLAKAGGLILGTSQSGASNTDTKQSGTQTGATTSQGSQTGSQTQTGTASQTGQSTVGGTSVVGSQGQTEQQSSSDVALGLLGQVFPQLFGQATSGQFSRQQAITDSQGVIDQVVKTLQEQTLPQVYGAESATGAYNGTTKSLLANDLTARAAGEAAARVSANVSNYAAIQAQQNNALVNAISTAVSAQRSTTGTQTGAQTTTNNQQTTNQTTGQTTGQSNSQQNTTGATTSQQSTAQTGNSQTQQSTKDPGLLGQGKTQTAAAIIASLGGAQYLIKTIGPEGFKAFWQYLKGVTGPTDPSTYDEQTGIVTGNPGNELIPGQIPPVDIPPPNPVLPPGPEGDSNVPVTPVDPNNLFPD